MLLLLIALASGPNKTTVPCWIAEAYVATLGEKGARNKGKAHGYSDAEIEAIKARCKIK
jgi:hypothetical protein